MGRPWLWIGVPETGHACPPSVKAFARDYFAAVLAGRGKLDPARDGLWVDIDRLCPVQPGSEHPTVIGWLPDRKLYEAWRKIQQPGERE